MKSLKRTKIKNHKKPSLNDLGLNDRSVYEELVKEIFQVHNITNQQILERINKKKQQGIKIDKLDSYKIHDEN
ncbi:hypothetical protein [Mycoplasma nasistruthionis]|uniref:Uncharacterized protein n=1 Tax=Mycoplasma nasistruthionis TaxID=353852 RepID=A0A5B7XX52_9MOLU|nr:hypothetical protein [Mycoplasma nasistruthionis]QCZ36503.1 hypothetical protein FG904_00505 [Mycoplasma nasistruthionis]